MKTLITISALMLFLSCKKDPPVTVQNNTNPPVISVPVIDSVKSPIVGLEIGSKAPEISLRDTNGNVISLASIKNKLILIDFWASWCSPCRIENSNLTVTYPEFTDTTFKNASGFEILSVSIDPSKQQWINFLSDKRYSWKYNVLDTSFAFSQVYNVTGIPANFLIDKNGIIIAKDLRGEMLADTLKALLK